MEFEQRPSVLACHLRAFLPSPGVIGVGSMPRVQARWRRHRVDLRQLAEFLHLTGLRGESGLPMLFPHVASFPLQMAVLTHPRFPVSVWKVLQVRNRLLQHRPIAADAIVDMDTALSGQRILDKGVEFDLHTRVREGHEVAWESVNTFYVRGKFGQRDATAASAFTLPRGETSAARWQAPSALGWRFAALTGDYNGIHYWSWYARRLGFRRAFLHPQLVLGQCMARLEMGRTSGPERLDAWLRGPVYQRSEVHLLASRTARRVDFHLIPDDEHRPAIHGCWQSGAAVDRPYDAPGAAPVSGPSPATTRETTDESFST
jgi:hypothetical protein